MINLVSLIIEIAVIAIVVAVVVIIAMSVIIPFTDKDINTCPRWERIVVLIAMFTIPFAMAVILFTAAYDDYSQDITSSVMDVLCGTFPLTVAIMCLKDLKK